MADGTDDKSRSITLALIDAKLDTVIEKVAEVRECQKDQEHRIEALERDNVRHKERLGLVGALNLIVAAVGAWLGSRK